MSFPKHYQIFLFSFWKMIISNTHLITNSQILPTYQVFVFTFLYLSRVQNILHQRPIHYFLRPVKFFFQFVVDALIYQLIWTYIRNY
jgi:hypothetical protein